MRLTEKEPTVRKAFYLQPELWVALIAFAIAINSQFSALVDKYVINGDVVESIYWMQQFNDGALFKNDLLTDYAGHYHAPWGFYLLYRTLSFVIDPLTTSKILPIVLFVFSSLYLFKLVRQFTDDYTGFLAALLFMVMPIFLGSMVGGHPRAFAYPLLIAFLYYLMKQEYAKSSLLLVVQSLFYPMVFFLAALTYLFAFIDIRRYQVSLAMSRPKVTYFILGVVLSGALLSTKYVFNPNPSIGDIVSRSQMINRPEFSANGRADVLDIPSFPRAVIALSKNILVAVVSRYPIAVRQINKQVLNEQTATIIILVLLVGALSIVAIGIIKRRIFIPKEILYVFIASACMYTFADLLLFKLYQPSRYILYTVPLINVILISVGVAYLTTQVRSTKVVTSLKVLVILLLLLHFNINKGIGLKDYGNYYYHQSGISNGKILISQDLYPYLNSLPKDALIAAQPYLADNIPTFAQRKVLINFELSHPFFDKYWETIQKRTIDFFEAYYAHDCLTIRKFSDKYHIDYFVVDKRHFTETYLSEGKMYFEPFNSYIKTLVQGTNDFALLHISEQDQLFQAGDIFVFSAKILANKCPLGLNDQGYDSDQKITATKN